MSKKVPISPDQTAGNSTDGYYTPKINNKVAEIIQSLEKQLEDLKAENQKLMEIIREWMAQLEPNDIGISWEEWDSIKKLSQIQ